MNDSKKIRNLKAQLAQIDDDMPFADLQPLLSSFFFFPTSEARQVKTCSDSTDWLLDDCAAHCFFIEFIINNRKRCGSQTCGRSLSAWTAAVCDWVSLLVWLGSKWEGGRSQHVVSVTIYKLQTGCSDVSSTVFNYIFHLRTGFCPHLVSCLRSILLLGQYMLR